MAPGPLILLVITLVAPEGGPLRIGTDGAHADLGVAIQFRATTSSDFAAPPQQELELRRVRFSLRGETPHLRMALQLNTAPRSLELLDAWVEWRAATLLALRAGQTKTPLTRHRQQRFSDLAFPEWGIAVFHFGAERQLGMLVQLGGEHARFRFDGGVFSGQNARASFERGVAEAWGVRLPNPSDLRAQPDRIPFHPELSGRISWSSNHLGDERSVDRAGGPLRVLATVGGAWDLAPVRDREFRARVVPEVLVQLEHTSLDVGLYLGWIQLGGQRVGLGIAGLNAELSRWIDPGVVLGLRWSSVARSDDLLAAVAREAGRSPAGALHELTGALSLPLVGELLRLQGEVSWVRDGRDDLRVRAQLQLAW